MGNFTRTIGILGILLVPVCLIYYLKTHNVLAILFAIIGAFSGTYLLYENAQEKKEEAR